MSPTTTAARSSFSPSTKSRQQDDVALQRQYAEQGFVIIRHALDDSDFAAFDRDVTQLVNQKSSRTFTNMHDPAMCRFLAEHKAVESDVYNAVRALPSMRALALNPRITDAVHRVSGMQTFSLFEKTILRIDLPNVEEEVAHWHQDYFYVKGNYDVVTAWIPLQDVDETNGCLLVARGSHLMGEVPHPVKIGKRDCPTPEVVAGFDVISAPMQRGDILLFHTLLFHAGRLNRSRGTRYSFQFRYTPVGKPTDPGMGRLIPVPGHGG